MDIRERNNKVFSALTQAEAALVHMCNNTSAREGYNGTKVHDALIEVRAAMDMIDPYATLKAAAIDPEKQIRVRIRLAQNGWGEWRGPEFKWMWSNPPEDYEIRDKPKTRKVQLLAYIDAVGELRRFKQGWVANESWKRVPAEDMEVEVENG